MNFRQIINIAEEEKFRDIGFFIDKDVVKPIFLSLKNEHNGRFSCMLDSGASIPVWCSGERTLKLTFPQAELRKNLKGLLSGFGKGFEIVDVYYIPSVMLSNGQHSIVLNRTYLPVVNKDSFGANLILPSSLFKNSNILIAQMQSLPEKQLILQCHSLWYTMKYTKYVLNAQAVRKLRKDFNILNISDEDAIIGAEGELQDQLVQHRSSELTGVTESFTEEDSSQRSEDVSEQEVVEGEMGESTALNGDDVGVGDKSKGADVLKIW